MGCFALFMFVIMRIIRRYYKFPAPAFFIRLIDNPIRRKLIQKPELIAQRMDLEPGMIIVEIGPGKGNYTKAVAKKVIPGGRVYAIDIQEAVINRLKKKIKREKIDNIFPQIDDAYNLSFEEESVDRIFAIACLPEIPDPVKAIREFNRILKLNGLISFSELLPDPDYPRRKTEIRWAEEAGYVLDAKFGNWFTYQLNFKKQPE